MYIGKRVRFLPPSSVAVYINFTVKIRKRLREFKKQKSQGKAVKVTINSKEGNS
jgi:hypothetical protein